MCGSDLWTSYGRARLDASTSSQRLMVDEISGIESFDPKGLKKASARCTLEITPITFNVRVKSDKSLSQLRFFYGNPDDVTIKSNKSDHHFSGIQQSRTRASR